ncbi:hypothetical protein SPRG_02757 [Saprolegnia parasitica CBS 223.65]|uniref:Clu domain-containing protein n=1 Tax=Saprolegnia parasitica (strain CBS 223.65) TaxID=695850 RepID=A0A067CP68_SAPPC|nr:hypothetical protein SPRG_02757 [Saprolegnia parasitica CBS 223.65]KDO32278.1 hypothetical protein SPRG_02757 [Saprolegnia parasitica CBS 223.65]|eukprot:XP_012196734.1 hypothetical protein SPRG_02757 [Saprolegnia parasitica CBS 223.65]
MGQDVSVILDHDAVGRRSPPTAVVNEARFAFCETWDAKSVDHLLTTYTAQYQSLHGSELHKQDDRRQALESEILELEAHLLTRFHEADCSDDDGLRASLESKRRQLYAWVQMPSRDAIDYALPLHWSVYMAAAKHVETEAKFGALRRKRVHWHMATYGYEMEKDPTAAAELARMEMDRLKYAAPAPNHEIDGHTDDNASESEMDSLDGGDSDLDEDGDKDKDNKPNALTVIDLAPSPVLTEAALDALRVPPPPSPLFDPSLRSPIFFGYTNAPMQSPVDLTKANEKALADREAAYFELRIARAKKRIDDATAIERGKLKSLLERRDATLEKRQKVHAARAREMNEAKQEGLDPTADFFRKMALSGDVLAADEAKEDTVFTTQEAAILGRMAKASATGEDEIALLQALQFGRSPPIAPRRRKFHEAELAELTKSLGQARMDLENAAKTLDETKARLEAPAPDSGGPSVANPNHARTQLLFATDQVIAAEKLIANLAARISEEEFMLQRADVVRDLEALYLPSFALLEGLPANRGDPIVLRMELLVLFHAHAATLTAKLKYIYASYVDVASGRLPTSGLTRLLRSTFELFHALGEIHLESSLDDGFWANVAARACPPQGMTWHDFKRFSKDEIARSQLLARIFRVPWRLSGWSRLQTQTIAPLHQFELGAISLSDLKFTLAKQHLRPRMALVPHRMEILHIRALAMGANDPLKADYSKYLKSRKTKVLSNVVPLDHGAYRNLVVYRNEVAIRAAIRLQTSWRAKKGRHDAYMAAKKQAFYHAKGTALVAARAAAEAEWHKLEATKDMSLEKMKFDAKIRMRQVKLRTKGLVMDRRQVLCVMIEEAVQDALEEVDHRFREMEEDAGYVPVRLRFDPLNMEHFAEISSSLIDQLKRARLPTLETATLLQRIAEKDREDVPETTTPIEAPGPPPTFRSSAVEPKLFVPEASLLSKQAQMAARHIAMMRGVGVSFAECSSIEKRVWLALASSTPELDDWSDRLQYVCDGLTDFKLREFLLELPSKRHAIEYVLSFRKHLVGSNQNDELAFDREALVADLMGHFRLLRGVDALAESLMFMASSDVETSLRDSTAKTLDAQEVFLAKHVAKAQLKAAAIAAKARQRRANGRDLAKADAAMQKWKHAQRSLDLLQSRLAAANVDEAAPKTLPPSLHDRTCWAERLKRTLADASSDAWVEMFHVCQDFLHIASHLAVQIAREHYLPPHEKSILPTSLSAPFQMDGRNDDIVRSSHGKGHRFEVHNIRFQVAVDDHGRYDGADELAMKAAGAEVRNSALYLPTLLSCPNVLAPLVCTVDYCGLRVLCVAKLPIERYEVNDRGAITNISTEFVYGTNNRGRTVTYHSKSLDGAVRKANAALNLTAHGVRGTQDLTAKMLSGAGDMHGYLGRDEWLCLLRFRRSMPPEDPDTTRHLPSSTRGMSILWRQLRPTLVQAQPLPLSSDALSFLTNQTSDWETHIERVTAATAHLLDDVIPAFARKLATRPMYVDAPGFDLVAELHRHGINVRHLGYLRAQFRYQLAGTATMTFNSNVVRTTQDMTREVQRGDVVYIHGDTYNISTSRDDEVSTTTLTLDRPYPHDSTQNVTVATGSILDPTQQLRDRLLVEMLQRTIKNLLRFALRQLLKSRQLAIGPNHTQLVLTYLNFLSGVGDGAHAFWDTHVFDGVRSRFGPIAVSYVERLNLRRAPVAIAKYLCKSLGMDLTADCWAHFTASPHGFVFTADDLVLASTGRIKHNMSLLHYAAASLLLDRASLVQGTTYQAGVLHDAPVGYWPLAERRGSKVARNLGSSSDHGKFASSCVLEASGPIANDDLCRAVSFPYAAHAYIACHRTQRWESTVTLEAWACPTKDGSGIRAILSHGRCTLAVLKNHRWGAWVNMRNIDVVVTGGLVAFGEWTHVACTFDGATLLLYVGGVLHGDLDVVSEVDVQLQRRDAKFAALRANLEAQEEVAKTDCFKTVERESRVYFSTKEGKKFIAELAKKVRDEAEFKERLNKKASQRKLEAEATPVKVKPATKPDYDMLAKQQHTTAIYHAKVDAIMDAFKKLRVDLNTKIDNEIAEELSKDSRPCRIGCVANASSNGKYFVGSLAHLAYYTKPLSRDTLYRHYLVGSIDRATTSDRLFELSAARFTKALAYTPEEPSFLAAYAINICSSLKYDLDHRRSQEMYKAKVRRALSAFRLRENYKGCAEILKYLPRDVRFSDLFREGYRCVTELCPSYWTPNPTASKTMSLLDLASLPVHYFLSGNPAQSSLQGLLHDEVAAYADIICRVVTIYATHYGDGLTDLKWLCDLETPSVVVYFVLWLQAGEDGRRFDLSSVPTVTPKDMDVITSANRSCLALNLAKCTALTDKTICMIAVRCSGLEALDVSGLSHLSDVSVLALAKSCRNLKSLHASDCGLLTDAGIEALAACMDLRELILTGCGKLTDDSLRAIGLAHTRLTRLELGFCIQLSDFEGFARVSNALNLSTLDVSGCRRLQDVGLAALSRKFTKLTSLNLAYCDKITDVGLWAVTHNCLELTSLNLQELVLLTDKAFTFDHEGDGRANVAQSLLQHLQTIVLADCKGLSDTGIAYLHHRARSLESLDVSGCLLATDQMLKYTTLDIFNGTEVGSHLRVLDLSFCMQVTSDGLRYIRDRCKHLVTLFLTGCVGVTDDAIIALLRACPRLSRLGLGYCRDVTDAVLFAIADTLWLQVLSLTRCGKITDAGVAAVATQCNGLSALTVASCKRLTDASMAALLEHCPKLLELDVAYCPHITSHALAPFVSTRLGMVLRSDCPLSAPPVLLHDDVLQERLFREASKKLQLPPLALHTPRRLPTPRTARSESDATPTISRNNDDDDDDDA